MFSHEEKRAMLQTARDSIARQLGLPIAKQPPAVTPPMQAERGVFVTLHKGSRLRGCIGNIEGRKPLHQGIAELAIESAFGDPRFPRLTADEFSEIDVEISVLTPLKRIDDVKQIEVGKHGIYIRKGFDSGLLLPQVATQYNWDRETFLEQTCWKAGLPKEAWKKDAEIYVFAAEVFGERELSNNSAD